MNRPSAIDRVAATGATSGVILEDLIAAMERYEAAWRRGERPRIEDAVNGVRAAERPEWLRELVALEIELRRSAGEHPKQDEYLARFREWAAAVVLAFALEAARPEFGARLRGAPTGPQDPHGGDRAGVSAIPAICDRYQLLNEIGRGGMGVVYRAFDGNLPRHVAVKVMQFGRDPNEFFRESSITSGLRHPGIAAVYERGTLPNGSPFYAMELIEGPTLATELKGRNNSDEDRHRDVERFEAIVEAIAHAHLNRVIHRDLKPTNIALGPYGVVRVLDWGLAKVLPPSAHEGDARAGEHPPLPADLASTPRESVTGPGVPKGTPAYMAPEQACGLIDAVNERTDVFGLGAILCEILTGAPPYTGESPGEVFSRARQGDLGEAYARLDQCRADPELVSLAIECLQPDPIARPAHAGVVAARVTAYRAAVEERLRAAKLDSVKALAQADEERRRRRTFVWQAAALLALAVTLGAAWNWQERQRQTRAAIVDVAYGEAELLWKVAKASVDDPSRWAEARQAARHVKQMSRDARDRVTRERITALDKAVSDAAVAATQNRELIAKLLDINVARADRAHGVEDGSRTENAYKAAFRSADLDIDVLEPAEVGARIRRLPPDVAQALIVALDIWAIERRTRDRRSPNWARLNAAARAADPDPQREALRDAFLEDQPSKRLARLRPLASRVDARTWASASLVQLGMLLAASGDTDGGVEVLQSASVAHPGDVWVHFALGILLEQTRPAQIEKATQAYLVARALRPETAHQLAHALEFIGRVEEAKSIFDDLTERRPTNVHHLGCYGRFLLGRGFTREAVVVNDRAVSACREATRLAPDDALAHANLGFVLSLQDRFGDAAPVYREMVRLEPDNAMSRVALGNALLGQGAVDEAEAACREAIRLEPRLVEAHTTLGNALVGRGRFAEAEAACRDALRLRPDDVMARVALGNALVAQKKFGEAEAACREAIRLRPYDVVARATLANALAGQKKFGEAETACREAIQLRPDNVPAYLSLGGVLSLKERFDEAAAAYREAIRLRPGDGRIHVSLGNALVGQGKFVGAEAVCREAVRLKPDDALAYVILGNALGSQEKFGETAAACGKAIWLNPGDAPAYVTLGSALASQGKFAAAAAACRMAIWLEPEHAAAHLVLANALLGREKFDEAAAACREAIRLEPDYAPAHRGLGDALMRQRKYDEAATVYREAIRLRPAFAADHRALGDALACCHKHAEAVAAYREMIRLRPDDAQAYNILGNALLWEHRDAEAVVAYREVIRLRPDDASAHVTLSDALLRQGKFGESAAACREAIRLNPAHAEAHAYLGDALLRQGRFGESAAACREAIKLKPAYAGARVILCNALMGQGKFDEALAACREATSQRPEHAEAHYRMGLLLELRGDYIGAVAALTRARDLAGPSSDVRQTAEFGLIRVKRFIGVAGRLTAVVQGTDRPSGAREALDLAYVSHHRGLHGVAARLFAESFAANPNLEEDRRAIRSFLASKSAALAGCGTADDDLPLGDAAKARLRQQARDWLRADLTLRAERLKAGTLEAHWEVRAVLMLWKNSPELAGLRDRHGLAKLPETERADCRALWDAVDALLMDADFPDDPFSS